ncbi:hypothetical protein J132_03144 [Termitomyces sp. J132]|nr:hypothetical protein J132_03144 [Termitomyces sp. J132]
MIRIHYVPTLRAIISDIPSFRSFPLLLSIVEAFELSNPPSISPGELITVNWTFAPNDPKDFDLRIGFCENFNNSSLFDQMAIDTEASSQRNALISQELPEGLTFPASCFVQALNSETGELLVSHPVQLVTTNSTFFTFTGPPSTASTSANNIVTSVTTSSSSTILSAPPSTSPSSSQSAVLPDGSLVLSLSPALSPIFSASTTSEETSDLSATSGAAAAGTTSTTTPNTSSGTSEGTKRSTGLLVGEVLGGVFAFVVLVSIFIALCIWRRRRHRQKLRNKYPFVLDEIYPRHISERDELEATEGTIGTWMKRQSSQRSMDSVTTDKTDLEKGDSVETERGTGTGFSSHDEGRRDEDKD